MKQLIERRNIAIALLVVGWTLTLGVFGLIQSSWERERQLYERSLERRLTELKALYSSVGSAEGGWEKQRLRSEALEEELKGEKEKSASLARELEEEREKYEVMASEAKTLVRELKGEKEKSASLARELEREKAAWPTR